MAYIQKNNPFKKLSSSPVTARKSPFFSTETPVETGGETEGETKELTLAEKSRNKVSRRYDYANELGDIRVEIGESDRTKNNMDRNLDFIKTADKAAPEALDKVMSMPEKDMDIMKQELVNVTKPFIGLKEAGITEIAGKVKDLDLSNFKQFFKKAGVSVGELSNIISAQIDNLPDLNKDGTPDMFEGVVGKIKFDLLNRLIAYKLKALN